MAHFKPFHATYYHSQKVKIGDVIAPPYDVISAPEQERLYLRSPYNCVRLILNKDEPSDHEGNSRYTRARDFFHDWCKAEILVEERTPCYYLYCQKFLDPITGVWKERTSIMGRLRLEPFEKGVVIPHEKTLAGPKRDRIKLLETVETNFSPIFGLYQDPGGEIDAVMRKLKQGTPRFEARDEAEVTHLLYPVEDPREVSKIARLLSTRKIFIADGHHRYTTALQHALNKRRALNLPAGREIPSDYVLAALVAFEDPGLVMEPTHRLIPAFPGLDVAQCLDLLKPCFKFEPSSGEKLISYFSKAKADPRSPSAIEFGLVTGQGQWLITLQDEAEARKKMPAQKPEFWYRLDVNVLSHLVFASLWGWPESEWEAKLRFAHSAGDAVAGVMKNAAAISFLLKAPEVRVLSVFGEAGELMPQKSTYFYPKLASGLVFYRHDLEYEG